MTATGKVHAETQTDENMGNESQKLGERRRKTGDRT